MATIIDRLLIELGLDAKGVTKGSGAVQDTLKKTRAEADRTAKDMEASNKRQTLSFGKLRNEVVGLFLAFSGAASLQSYFTGMIASDAATGRLAKNLGMATQELSAWQLAMKDVGGQATDADSAFRKIAGAYQDILLTGTTANAADFQGLGLNSRDLSDPVEALLKMADASERMERSEFFARLSRIGIPESMINSLAKGRAGIMEIVEAKRKEAAATEANAQEAAKMEKAWSDLASTITGKVRPVFYEFVTKLTEVVDQTGAANLVIPVMTGLVGALALVVGAAYWPVLLLAGAIAVVAANIDKLKNAWEGYNSWWDDFKSGFDGPLDPLREAMGLGTGAEMRRANGTGEFREPGPAAGIGQPFGGGGTRGGVPVTGRGSKQDQIVHFFKSRGYSNEAALGIAAGVTAEAGKDWERSFNPAGGGRGAQGIGQWRGKRLDDFYAMFGKGVMRSTMAEQLQFMEWELRNTEASAGGKIRGARSAGGALSTYILDFMRPGKGAETSGDFKRGNAWLRSKGLAGASGGGSSVNIGSITVHTQATDAQGIAAALPGAIQRRGLNIQATRGLD